MESVVDSDAGVLLNQPQHHIRQELCTNRPAYRQGRNLTAVKVYTITAESQHLLVYGVPNINLRTELKSLFSKYGPISQLHVVKDAKTEIFTECYHIRYQRIQSARFARRSLDDKSFYGGILHICYGPEYETVEECRNKLLLRNREVLIRLQGDTSGKPQNVKQKIESRKRKYPAREITEERLTNVDQSKVWQDIPQEIDPRIPENVFRNVNGTKKHYQVRVDPSAYGPQLPENFKLESSLPNETTELEQLVIKNNAAKDVCNTNTQCQPEKAIIFRK